MEKQFNKFFVNVGESLANEILSIDRCPSEYIRVEISENFFVSAVTEDEIGKIICNFKDSVAGWDDLRPRMIKLIQSCIKAHWPIYVIAPLWQAYYQVS